MATFAQYVHVILSIILVLSLYSEALPDVDTNTATPQTRWCVENPAIGDLTLKGVIDVICGKADCSPIKEGGSCFLPDTLINHASFAVNLYYQNNGRDPKACHKYFGVGTDQDPSSDKCHYP
ncbi:hypothetical protein ACOSQ2_008990 [Xanthoceras sorbifolium]